MRAWKFGGIGMGMKIEESEWKGMGYEYYFIEDEDEGRYEHMLYSSVKSRSNMSSEHPFYWLWKPLRTTNSEKQESDSGGVDALDEVAQQEFSESPQGSITTPSTGHTVTTQPALFECPEPNCIRKYQYESNLATHLIVGKHMFVPERRTLKDYAIGFYKNRIDAIQTAPLLSIKNALRDIETGGDEEYAVPIEMGWAHKPDRKGTTFDQEQISFLRNLFNEGARSGKKYDPREVAKMMKNAKHPDGITKRFSRSQLLTWNQISGFFSRTAAKQRKEPVPGSFQDENILENFDDEQKYMEDSNFPTTEEAVMSHLQENYDQIFLPQH